MSHNFKSVGNPRSITVNPENAQLGYKLRAFWGKNAEDPASDPVNVQIRSSDGSYSVIGEYADIDKAGMYFYEGNVITPFIEVSESDDITYGLYTVNQNGETGELIDLYTNYFYEVDESKSIESDFTRVFSSLSDAAAYADSEEGNTVYAKENGNMYEFVSGLESECDGVFLISAQNNLQLKMLNGGVFTENSRITVGSGGAFADLNSAIDSISSCVANVGVSVVIHMLSGYEINDIVVLDGLNLGFLSLEAEDSSLQVNQSVSNAVQPYFHNEPNDVAYSDINIAPSGKYLFYINGGIAPSFDFNFNYLGVYASRTILNISQSTFSNMFVGDSSEVSSCWCAVDSIITCTETVDVSGLENAIFLNCRNIPTLSIDANVGTQNANTPFMMLCVASSVSCGEISFTVNGQNNTIVYAVDSKLTTSSNLIDTYNAGSLKPFTKARGSDLTIKNTLPLGSTYSSSLILCDLSGGSFITMVDTGITSNVSPSNFSGVSAFNTVSSEGCVWKGS